MEMLSIHQCVGKTVRNICPFGDGVFIGMISIGLCKQLVVIEMRKSTKTRECHGVMVVARELVAGEREGDDEVS